MLTPQERALNRRPSLDPEWTWMTEGQAALVLKAHGYDFIFNLERAGQFWRGKAMRDGLPSLCRQVAFFTSGHSFFTGSGDFFAIVRPPILRSPTRVSSTNGNEKRGTQQ